MRILIASFLVVFILTGCSATAGSPGAVEIAKSFIALHPDSIVYKQEAKSRKWNYEQGLMYEAFYQMWLHTGDASYLAYIKQNLDYYIEPGGGIRTYKLEDYNIDNVSPGRMLMRASEIWGDWRYRKAADLLRSQLQTHPRTSGGGFWHKKIYPYQMWLDGLYMGEPFYAHYARVTGNDTIWNDVLRQFRLIVAHNKDAKTGLYYHGWDESREMKWANRETGQSPNFWGRALGWYMVSLVEVLGYLPENHPDRGWMIGVFGELAEAMLKYRDPETKLWYQVVDQGNREGNYLEASVSSMCAYAFAKGCNLGYLPEKFGEAARESFEGILKHLVTKDEQGHLYLEHVCSVSGLGGNPYRDGSFEYYVGEPQRRNDFKGYGPFLLAAIEIERAKAKR
jgi:unsaturated rhamnogalacturonyl hydrolase